MSIEDKIQEAIENSELVKMAAIEAIHRLFYDNANARDTTELSDYISTIWCMYPDWRQRLYRSLERYKSSYEGDLIKDLPIINKPRRFPEAVFNVAISIDRKAKLPVMLPKGAIPDIANSSAEYVIDWENGIPSDILCNDNFHYPLIDNE